VRLRILGLGKVNFLPADDQEATQRQAGATTKTAEAISKPRSFGGRHICQYIKDKRLTKRAG